MFASGACGLVWQMVWTAGFGVALGHELVAVLSVMGAFFGGLAAGSFLLAARIEHSAHPARWYAALEAIVAAWGLAVALALPHLSAPVARWLGPQPSEALHALVAFGVPLALLLPATLAMGATLPALERQLRAAHRSALPLLYAANTAGALAGVLAAVFVAIPEFGLLSTAWAAAGVNLACAFTVLLGLREAVPVDSPPATGRGGAKPSVRLFATGLLGIGYEVLAVRVLAQICENTIYTYALLLAVFLFGTAAGSAWWRRAARRETDLARWADKLLLALAFAVLASGAALWWLDVVHRATGDGFVGELAGEALAAAVALLAPSLVMGALFTVLCTQAREQGIPLGRAVGWNTLGCALAPGVVGALLVPALGAKVVLVLLGLGYVALLSRQAWESPRPAIAALLLAALAGLAPALRFVDVPPGGRILSYREGALASVSVASDAEDVARLHINNRVQEGSSAGGMIEMRLAQLPLLLHPAPREALFLGLGTGYTAHAAAVDASVHVTAVELLPEVADASTLFMLRPAAPRAARPVDVVIADARRYVLADPRQYDVIVADLFHPARSGAASLYTVEHFRAVRERLAPGGVFCQWLALHQMDVATLRSITAAFLEAFPDAIAVLAANNLDTPVIGLVARPGHARWSLEAIQARMAGAKPSLAAAFETARIDSGYAVLGSVLADTRSLQAFAHGVPVNSDDQPVVAHQAARVDYEPEAAPRERLANLLRAFPATPDVLEPNDPAVARLGAYWAARGRYVELGLRLQPDPDPRVMLDRAGPGLIDIVRASPEFQPAAEALAAIAKALQGSDYPLSQRVLAALRRAQGEADTRTPQ